MKTDEEADEIKKWNNPDYRTIDWPRGCQRIPTVHQQKKKKKKKIGRVLDRTRDENR